MFQTQLIQQVVEWERRLEIEEQKRKNFRCEPELVTIAEPHPFREKRPSLWAIIASIFLHGKKHSENRQTAYPCPTEPCGDTPLR